jgi:hypothetical protein
MPGWDRTVTDRGEFRRATLTGLGVRYLVGRVTAAP